MKTLPETPREAALRRHCDESGARYDENDFDADGTLKTLSVDVLDRLDNAKLAGLLSGLCEAAYHNGRCEAGRIFEEVIERLSAINGFDVGSIVRVPPGYGSGELAVVVGPATESVCVRLGNGRLCNLDLDEVTADEDLEDET